MSTGSDKFFHEKTKTLVTRAAKKGFEKYFDLIKKKLRKL